jgi:hypothetical protein
MRACSQCGESNAENTVKCSRCGAALSERSRLQAGTLLGIAPGAVQEGANLAPQTLQGAALNVNPKHTLMGLSPEQQAAHPLPAQSSRANAPPALAAGAPSPASPTRAGFDAKRTMMGGVGPSLPQANDATWRSALDAPAPSASEPRPAAHELAPQTARSSGTQNALAAAFGSEPPNGPPSPQILHPGGESATVNKTLLGMPVPQTEPNVSPEAQGEHLTAAWARDSGRPSQQFPAQQRTLLGVATPGIAPLNPGVPKPPSLPPKARAKRNPAAAAGAKRKGGRILLAVAALLLSALALFWVLWTPPPPLTAKAVTDEQRSERLEFSCADCPPGSRVTLDGVVAEFASGRALLTPKQALQLGSNRLKVDLSRPGLGRDESVTLDVPLRFRIRADLTALAEPKPMLALQLDAVPGASAVVDGNPVPLVEGHARVLLDPGSLTGSVAEVGRIERKVAYSVALTGSPPQAGEVQLTALITPLVIEAPGPSVVTDSERFVLAGRTQPGAKLSVAGYPLTVDPVGRFDQLMNIDSVGETTIVVRADAEGQAPRFVNVVIRRVPDLAAEADRVRVGAATAYADVLAAASGGTEAPVSVMGTVEESRTVDNATTILLDVKTGCDAPPCWAKVLLSQRYSADKGTLLEAHGTTRQTVQSPFGSALIPVVQATFAVRRGGDAKAGKLNNPSTSILSQRL